MDPTSIHDALAQVREVRQRVIERQRFLGYSSNGRFASAALPPIAAWIMTHPSFPMKPFAMLIIWSVTAIVAAAINYGLCLRWYSTLPAEARRAERLFPLIDSLPPLIVAAAVTAALVYRGEYDLLFGAWMSLYGLINFYAWHHLPRSVRSLGMFYVACGAFFLLHPAVSILNPWPMALVYTTGEIIGGMILRQNERAGRLWPALSAAREGSE